MPRNRRPNQIARATCSFVLSHDLTWCQREEKGLLRGLLTQNCRRRHFRASSRTCSSTSLVEEPAVGGLDTSRSERSARKQSLHSSGGKEDFVTLPTSYFGKIIPFICSPLFYMMYINEEKQYSQDRCVFARQIMIGVSRRHTIIMCSGSNVTAYQHLPDASCTRFYRLCPQTLPVSVQGKGRVQTIEEPITIGQMFRQTVSSYPDTPALGSKEGEEWKKINYSVYNCIIKVTIIISQ